VDHADVIHTRIERPLAIAEVGSMTGLLDVGEILPTQRTITGRLLFEIGLVSLGLTLAGICAHVLDPSTISDQHRILFVLAVVAAAIGAAAVGMGQTAGRITGNRRAAWLVPALALYSLEIIPDTTLSSRSGWSPPADVGLLLDCVVLAGMIAAGIRPPARLGAGTAWLVAGGCLLVSSSIGAFVPLDLAADPGLDVPAALDLAVLLGWCAVSLAVIGVGYRMASPPLWRIGLGFGVIAVAHVLRNLHFAPWADPAILFSVERLFGVVVVMLGMSQLLRRALQTLLTERFSQQEELRMTSIQAQQAVRAAAEREHELRNSLCGLAGVTHLLRSEMGNDSQRARSAAVTELDRLAGLLGKQPDQPANTPYSATEVVEELVALWRMTGMAVEAVLAGELMVVGRRATLAQVLTNLLANCARHAPGARVRIAGRSSGDRTVIEIRDEGRPQQQSGDRAATRDGGIGLDLCRRLLSGEGGVLKVHPPDPCRPGWTVSVELVGRRSAPQQDRPQPCVALDAGAGS
jgi:two-component system, OmpR family, sensor kinase